MDTNQNLMARRGALFEKAYRVILGDSAEGIRAGDDCLVRVLELAIDQIEELRAENAGLRAALDGSDEREQA